MPTLANSFNVNCTAADLVTLVSPSFTPAIGDVIVVKAVKENDNGVGFDNPFDTQGNSYTLRTNHSSVDHCQAWIWTAVAGAATSMTVSLPMIGSSTWRSMTVEQWTNAALAGTPAVNSTESGTGTPSATLTTTQDLSVVTWCNGDWSANDPSGRVYNSTSAAPTEDGFHDKSGTGNYVAYYAYQNATSAGSQTFGLTSPGSQTWTMLGIEILDIASAPSDADPNQAPILAWQ